MEQEHQIKTSNAGRFLLLAALLVLAASAAAAFGDVFRGGLPRLELVLAAVAALLLAFLAERRHTFVATVVSLGGLIVAAGIIVFPDTTWFGIPTAHTFGAVAHSFGVVGTVAEAHVAPTLPFAPLLLAALTAVWTATYSAHVLAVRARSPFLALLPPGTLMAFTSLVVAERARHLYVIPFLIAALGVVYADGMRRLAQWGPLTVWRREGRRRATGVSTRGARRLAFACLVIALAIPGVLPGFGAKAYMRVKGATRSSAFVSVDPIVDIRPALIRTPAAELFTVKSDGPAYWRSLALDNFNGRQWTSSDPQARDGVEVRTGVLQRPPDLPSASLLHQRFQFEKLNQPWLPAAYDPVSLAAQGTAVRFDPLSSALVVPDGAEPGFAYGVTSRVVSPSPQQLDHIAPQSDAFAARYTALPTVMPPEIYAIAHRLTDRYPTVYRKVLAIQTYLRAFRYDERVPPGHGLNDILYFLTRSRAGYCEQFAGTMAVLLRALGIPARVVLGFTTGNYDPSAGVYRVTTRHLHSWVEVLFPQVGWLPFEPTPSRSNPVGIYTSASPTFSRNRRPAPRTCVVPSTQIRFAAEVGSVTCASGRQRVTTPARPATRGGAVANPRLRGEAPRGGTGAARRSSTWRYLPLFALAAVVVLGLTGVPVIKVLRRRRAIRRARGPRERILAAYDFMSARAGDVGVGRRSDETVQEYTARVKATVAFSDGHVDELSRLVGLAAYGTAEPSTASADEAVKLSRRISKEIAQSKDAAERVIGLYRPTGGRFGPRSS